MQVAYNIPIKPNLKQLVLNPPFKSKNKVKSILKNNYNVNATNFFLNKYIPTVPKFNKKEASKKQYKYYSMPGGYIGDIIFTDGNRIAFLLLIEINTRKAYAQQLNNIKTTEIINVDDETYERQVNIETKKIKTTESLMHAFENFLRRVNSPTPVSSLRFDGEAGINSRQFQEYLRSRNINFISTPPNQHTSLSLIDRLCRTIRDMAYLMNVEIYDQSIMDIILDYYNNSPHKTLTQLFFKLNPYLRIQYRFGISPNDVTPELETLYIKECYKYNLMIKSQYEVDFNLENPTYCYLVEDKGKFVKSRSGVDKDLYMIVGKEGNLYTLYNTKNKTIKYAPISRIII